MRAQTAIANRRRGKTDGESNSSFRESNRITNDDSC